LKELRKYFIEGFPIVVQLKCHTTRKPLIGILGGFFVGFFLLNFSGDTIPEFGVLLLLFSHGLFFFT